MSARSRAFTRVVEPNPATIFAARGSLAWRRVDAELADLSFDSLVDGDLELAGVRSGDDSIRLVSFDGPDLTVEVEVAAALEFRNRALAFVNSRPGTHEQSPSPASTRTPDSRE